MNTNLEWGIPTSGGGNAISVRNEGISPCVIFHKNKFYTRQYKGIRVSQLAKIPTLFLNGGNH